MSVRYESTRPNRWPMTPTERIGWGALWANLALTGMGVLSVFVCNVLQRYCEAVALYLGSALFLGLPLCLLKLVAAPVGTFRAHDPRTSRRYRRVLMLNLGLVALLFLPALLAVLFV